MTGGVLLIASGVWVLTQVFGGGALARLGVIASADAASAATPGSSGQSGLGGAGQSGGGAGGGAGGSW